MGCAAAVTAIMTLRLRVICRELPGIRFCDVDGNVREPVYLGIQERRNVIEQVPANVAEAVFCPEFRVERVAARRTFWDRSRRARRPIASSICHGACARPLVASMFWRLKVRLGQLKWKQIEAVGRAGQPITVRLRLTDSRGGPLCATPKASHIEWQA